ncbi:hypothetical protein [Desulfosporosinus sp. SB140]|uniref:hypothetical protein n=1 Tax=Desulfosporosinus paludis TaxID=3115649 RepID=UPI003890F3CD
MKFRVHHLYAAKLSITEHLFTKPLAQLKPLFKDGIVTSKNYLTEYESIWALMDVQRLYIKERELIIGVLCRGRDQNATILDVASTIAHLKEDSVKNVATTCNFVFDYETEIVVFEEKVGKVSKLQFAEMFVKLILAHSPDLGEIDSELIPLANIIKEEIRKFKSIHYARFELRPANWNDDDDFSDFDSKLKLLKTNKAIQAYESQGGLNTESELFRKPVNMVVAGYGKLDLKGIDKEGIGKQLNSENELLCQTIDAPDEELVKAVGYYYEFLLKAIKQHKGASKDD